MTTTKAFAMAALAAACFGAGTAQADGQTHGHSATEGQITISCYRGPWTEVIWDRANTVFVDSLVGAGYSYAEAYGIAQRLCRDQDLVGNPDGLVAAMNAILASNPPG